VTAPTNLDCGVIPVRNGWRVRRVDGTARTILQRQSGEGWAVFDGTSSDAHREPPLGYPGSWRQDADDAIEWARSAGVEAS
jgi:hypothetical protein